MDTALLTALLFVIALIVLDLAAHRFGADSRRTGIGEDRRDWW